MSFFDLLIKLISHVSITTMQSVMTNGASEVRSEDLSAEKDTGCPTENSEDVIPGLTMSRPNRDTASATEQREARKVTHATHFPVTSGPHRQELINNMRELLVPIVVGKASLQSRLSSPSRNMPSDRDMESKAKSIITDDMCEDFIRQAITSSVSDLGKLGKAAVPVGQPPVEKPRDMPPARASPPLDLPPGLGLSTPAPAADTTAASVCNGKMQVSPPAGPRATVAQVNNVHTRGDSRDLLLKGLPSHISSPKGKEREFADPRQDREENSRPLPSHRHRFPESREDMSVDTRRRGWAPQTRGAASRSPQRRSPPWYRHDDRKVNPANGENPVPNGRGGRSRSRSPARPSYQDHRNRGSYNRPRSPYDDRSRRVSPGPRKMSGPHENPPTSPSCNIAPGAPSRGTYSPKKRDGPPRGWSKTPPPRGMPDEPKPYYHRPYYRNPSIKREPDSPTEGRRRLSLSNTSNFDMSPRNEKFSNHLNTRDYSRTSHHGYERVRRDRSHSLASNPSMSTPRAPKAYDSHTSRGSFHPYSGAGVSVSPSWQDDATMAVDHAAHNARPAAPSQAHYQHGVHPDRRPSVSHFEKPGVNPSWSAGHGHGAALDSTSHSYHVSGDSRLGQRPTLGEESRGQQQVTHTKLDDSAMDIDSEFSPPGLFSKSTPSMEGHSGAFSVSDSQVLAQHTAQELATQNNGRSVSGLGQDMIVDNNQMPDIKELQKLAIELLKRSGTEIPSPGQQTQLPAQSLSTPSNTGALENPSPGVPPVTAEERTTDKDSSSVPASASKPALASVMSTSILSETPSASQAIIPTDGHVASGQIGKIKEERSASVQAEISPSTPETKMTRHAESGTPVQVSSRSSSMASGGTPGFVPPLPVRKRPSVAIKLDPSVPPLPTRAKRRFTAAASPVVKRESTPSSEARALLDSSTLRVPGVWLVHPAQSTMVSVNRTFDIDEETARTWNLSMRRYILFKHADSFPVILTALPDCSVRQMERTRCWLTMIMDKGHRQRQSPSRSRNSSFSFCALPRQLWKASRSGSRTLAYY